jgi:hypothetical protein
LDDGDQSNAAFDLFQRSKQSEHYAIELLIVQRKADKPRQNAPARAFAFVRKRGLVKTLAKAMFVAIAKVEKLLFARGPKYAAHFRRHSLDKFDAEKLVVTPRASKSGLVYRYSDADLDEIRKRNLDVLVRGGSGILRGGILNVCRSSASSPSITPTTPSIAARRPDSGRSIIASPPPASSSSDCRKNSTAATCCSAAPWRPHRPMS